ncbi:GntR family transcriptional regulator [Streptomyces sp. NPDC007084]|uniref:GntR family transcriptional regulator n=1 Tax=Streptomyces sp. NPDC007084 TaxID=3154313 RepID=UPI003452CB5D
MPSNAEPDATGVQGEPLPLYSLVARRLRSDITDGGMSTGDRLPSERVLAERYEVSRVTMRSALNRLAEEGLIASAPARGWFLQEDRSAAHPALSRPSAGRTVQGFADYALRHGLAVRTRVLDSGVRAATIAEAEELRIAPGAPLFSMRRLRFLDDLVVVIEHNRLPLALCPALATTDFSHASLYATLRQADPPQAPHVADYSVEARQPDAEERELLEIADTTPVLVATQLAFNQEARPLELTVATYRGDRYRFRASITD